MVGLSDMLLGSNGVYHYYFLLSYEDSFAYLISQNKIYINLEENLVAIRKEFNEDLFVKMFVDLENESSKEGKIIRLKIIENMLKLVMNK